MKTIFFLLLLHTSVLLSNNIFNPEFNLPRSFLQKAFPQDFHQITISNLEGGYSEAMNYLVQKNGNAYVLKMHQIDESPSKLLKEQYAMQEAAKLGISPRVFYIDSSRKSILMDFVKGSRCTQTFAKSPQFFSKISEALRKIHAIKPNPYEDETFKMKAEGIYAALSSRRFFKNQGKEAIDLIRKIDWELSSKNYPKTNIHGDLNPGNILIDGQKIHLIDWYETLVEDPFHDLAFLSISHSYNSQEEYTLLMNYLGSVPREADIYHFNQIKKINLAVLSLTYFWVTNELMENSPGINSKNGIKDWSFYSHLLSLKGQNLSAQFFYEAATRALMDAKAVI